MTADPWAPYPAKPELVQSLKFSFLNSTLLAQFRSRPDCLAVEMLSADNLSLRLERFPGLDVLSMNARAFSELQIEGYDLSNAMITSGGPEGIYVQYRFEPRMEYMPPTP